MLLLSGVAILGGLLLLTYLFVNADPRRLARDLEWGLLAVGIMLVVALATSGRFILLWLPFSLLLFPAWRKWQWFRRSGEKRVVEAATPFLRVVRDPHTQVASGTVLRGTFAGSRLDELARDELILLLKEARIDDPEGGGLIEDYLNHAHPGWRDDLVKSDPDNFDMTIQEARDILGVDLGADEVVIAEAHRRLLRRLDGGEVGSDYFAIKINRARDVLLKK